MNQLLADFMKQPAHAVLVTGAAETASTEAVDAAQGLLGGYREGLKTVVPVKGTSDRLSIGVGQIHDLLGFFRLKTPGRAAIRRAAVITEADKMTREAQNALLKTLEEPPADSVLLLASEHPERLLPTIRSRVQTINLPKEFKRPETEAVQQVKQVLGGTVYDRLLLVDSMAKQKESLREFVDTLATVAMASLEAAAHRGTPVKRWQEVLQAAHTAQEALEQSGNAKLVLTELMLAL